MTDDRSSNSEELDLNTPEEARIKINLETAKISWLELQPNFARGEIVQVATELDLVDVVHQVQLDNKSLVEKLMASGKIRQVDDTEAKIWLDSNAELWAVVVKPWVFVQALKPS